MQPEICSVGTLTTSNVGKYLQQLCKHFAHKVEVRHDAERGEVALGTGPCRLWASPTELRIEVGAQDAPGLERAKHVVKFQRH